MRRVLLMIVVFETTSDNWVTSAAIDYANSYPDEYVPGAEVTDNAMKYVIWTIPAGIQ